MRTRTLALRLAALAFLLYWAVVLLRPFISIVVWSVVIAIALDPAFERVVRWLGGRRRLAAAVVTSMSLLVVVGPASWLALNLIESIQFVFAQLDWSALALPSPPPAVKTWPLVGEPIYNFWDLASNNIKAALGMITPYVKPLGSSLLSTAADTGTAILKFFGSIVIAGFLLPSAPALVDACKKLAHRLDPRRGDEFVKLAGVTIRAVSRGVVGISVLQALLAGFGLWLAGVPGTSLITSAVLILGIVQIGPALVLLPVVIWAWFAMEPTAALLFTAYMVPVNLLDNILKPIVMGHGLRVPMPIILIGVIGGVLAYGFTGLFLGPVVLSVVWELAVAWIDEVEAPSRA
jgi:predicted PurR-regulated permease PerM